MSVASASASDWIWSPARDLATFGGAAVVAVAIGVGLRPLGGGVLPEWAWLAFVLGLDVAHVWTTLFRTYLDREQLQARPLLYTAVPLACYLAGVAVYHASPAMFWRVLAYAAVFHFIRQQAGWVAIARARAELRARSDRWLDDAIVYLATGVPIVHWHAHLPRSFHWFVDGDFVAGATAIAFAQRLLLPVAIAYAVVALAYLVRAIQHARAGRKLWTKHLVVVSTALVWWVGIVLVDDDFTFTVTNVTLHAVPYIALLWAYAKARAATAPTRLVARVAGAGFLAFAAFAFACACVEEFAWDRLVWHDREWLFGAGAFISIEWNTFLVPLLALPQATHYALDGVLWRRKEGGAAQARALGFTPGPTSSRTDA